VSDKANEMIKTFVRACFSLCCVVMEVSLPSVKLNSELKGKAKRKKERSQAGAS